MWYFEYICSPTRFRLVLVKIILMDALNSILSVLLSFLLHDALVRTNRRDIAMMSVRLSGMGVHCDYTVHVSADLSF